jgi:hypothetical protein
MLGFRRDWFSWPPNLLWFGIGLALIIASVAGNVTAFDVSISDVVSPAARIMLAVLGVVTLGVSTTLSTKPADRGRSHEATRPAGDPEGSLRYGGGFRYGARGTGVRVWQQLLNVTQKSRLDEDGRFGPATRAATVSFQKQHGLDPDGIVGPETRQEMLSMTLSGVFGLGARGNRVRVWQQLLNATQNAGIDEDGRFGPATRAATVTFQKQHGLDPDGTVGRETRRRMAVERW